MPAKKALRAKKGHKVAAGKRLGKVKALSVTASALTATTITAPITHAGPIASGQPQPAPTGGTTSGWDISTNKPA
jgi:hypothetical protein